MGHWANCPLPNLWRQDNLFRQTGNLDHQQNKTEVCSLMSFIFYFIFRITNSLKYFSMYVFYIVKWTFIYVGILYFLMLSLTFLSNNWCRDIHYFFFIKVHLGTEARIQDILALFYHWHNLPYPRQKMGGWVLPFFVNGYCCFCSKGMISKLQLLYSSYFFVKTLLYSILLW